MSVCLLYTVWGRPHLLAKSLARVAELTLPDEILVVDDGTPDNSVYDACLAAPVDVRYVYTHNLGPQMCSHARNVGVAATECDDVLTSEPEMLFVTDVVAQMLEDRKEHPREFINAGTIHHEQAPGTGGCGCGCGQEMHTTVNWQAPWVAMYDRQQLLAVGGWDESFPDPWGWDDIDLGTRLRINNYGQFNDMRIEAIHQWHPPQIVDQRANEAYFKSKGLVGEGETPDNPMILANREEVEAGRWGRPKCR